MWLARKVYRDMFGTIDSISVLLTIIGIIYAVIWAAVPFLIMKIRKDVAEANASLQSINELMAQMRNVFVDQPERHYVGVEEPEIDAHTGPRIGKL